MNILTFDIEEWYNALFKYKISEPNYSVAPYFVHLLDLMKQMNVKPTFFVLSSFAEKHQELIYNISQRYDIGSHGHEHKLISSMTRSEFEKDTLQSLKILESITGKTITKYRAAGFSVTKNIKNYFEVLANTSIETDCSLSAVNHFYGKKNIDIVKPYIVECNGKQIKELPPSVIKLFGRGMGFLGGGYFRLLPYSTIKKQLQNNKDYNLIYLHPSDFDVNQPKIKGISCFQQFRRRVSLAGNEKKFLKLLTDFQFVDIESAITEINWIMCEKIKIL